MIHRPIYYVIAGSDDVILQTRRRIGVTKHDKLCTITGWIMNRLEYHVKVVLIHVDMLDSMIVYRSNIDS